MDPRCNNWCLYEREKRRDAWGEATWRQRQRWEVLNPKPRDIYSHQKLEEAGRTLPEATGGKRLCDALTSDFLLSRLCDNPFLFL